MYKGYVTFAFNPDGYGEYTEGFIADVEVEKAVNVEEALDEIKRVASEYYLKLVEEEDYELPYPWNWGDVVNEVPAEFLASHGCKFEHVGATDVVYHDEIVVNDD